MNVQYSQHNCTENHNCNCTRQSYIIVKGISQKQYEYLLISRSIDNKGVLPKGVECRERKKTQSKKVRLIVLAKMIENSQMSGLFRIRILVENQKS